MENRLKRTLVGFGTVIIGASMLAACHTVQGTAQGAARDISAATAVVTPHHHSHHKKHYMKQHHNKKVMHKNTASTSNKSSSSSTNSGTSHGPAQQNMQSPNASGQ